MTRNRSLVLLLAVLCTLVVAAAPASAGTDTGGPVPGQPYKPFDKSRYLPPSTAAMNYVPANLVIDRTWPAQPQNVRDITVRGATVTERTSTAVKAALAFGLTNLASISCWDAHAWNPSSEHSKGRACDLFFDYRTAAGRAAGWRLANFYIANQARLGVYYVIWQGRFWGAYSPWSWTTYRSSIYGCPNPREITGCHYDHLHISVY